MTVPAGCSRFEFELAYSPTSILKEKYLKLVHVTDLADGGHFAAFELPKVMAAEIYTAVAKMIEANSAAD